MLAACSRGLAIQGRTVEVFAMRGLADRFVSRGRTIPQGHFGGLSTGLDFSVFETGFPFTLLLPQAETETLLTERAQAEREAAIAAVQEGYLWLQEAWYPTIAAVRGYALGAGMQLALACDLRVAARGTRFGMLEATYGLMPDLTVLLLLDPDRVPPAGDANSAGWWWQAGSAGSSC